MIPRPWSRAATLSRLFLVLFTAAAGGRLVAADPPGAPTRGELLLEQLRTFATTGRVLQVGAHPDDENTQLIAYLSRGRAFDTGYLSITRGDGGQNILGPVFDAALGVVRTQELLAARHVDGGRQFFTRAIDFGFTKSPDETLSIWDHQQVLSDVVRVIRKFRPDVIITRFPIPPGSGGHGQHTASAILAVEAFKLAGDPRAFPDQLREGLTPWQPKRIMWNSSPYSRGGGVEKNPSVQVDIGGNDPVTGESFASIAGRSRSMHKTQGFGDFATRAGARLHDPETFVLLAGAPVQRDFMDGVDTTWGRFPDGAEIGRLADAAVRAFEVKDPAASVPALLEIRRRLAALPSSPVLNDKRVELDRVLQGCLGLVIAARVDHADVVPGETLPITATATLAPSVRTPAVRWVAVRAQGRRFGVDAPVAVGVALTRHFSYAVAPGTPVTQPYWLREPATVGMFRVADPMLIGRPENPPALPVAFDFSVGGEALTLHAQVTAAVKRGGDGVEQQPVAVVPPVSLAFQAPVAVFRPGTSRRITIDVTANRPHVVAYVAVVAPAGWHVSAPQVAPLAAAGARVSLAFEVKAPASGSVGELRARAVIDGVPWTTTTLRIDYPHIPPVLLQPDAGEKITSVDVVTRGHAIGYIQGTGDEVPDALRQLGYAVSMLAPAQLTPAALRHFDAVVVGARAFNTHDLGPQMPALFAYVEGGGTMVVQDNWPRGLRTHPIAPYPLALSQERVTNEQAPVTFLAPESPVLNAPNRITAADFEGWIQERGVYYASEWGSAFVPVLAMSDPGEAPLKGGLLVARYGKGYYVYTGLVFFRQLPAGVPGAYRLFANLVSLGK